MHKRGITAVSLVVGEDIGTAMAIGFSARPGLLRTYWIRKDKKADELTPIVLRAMALLDGRPVQAVQRPNGDEVDHYEDILTVMDDRLRMGTGDVLKALAQFDPKTYGGWTFGTLSALKVSGRSNGLAVVRRELVAAAITARGGEARELDAG
jgi:S-DNA-T family DNA segregation ATPase FtsK/SpoIIIE